MSKLTLDEAIKHCLEVAEEQELSLNDKEMYSEMLGEDYSGFEEGCQECAAEHRQLAEWLRELKKFREVYGVCPAYEMCIPECKEGYDAQIAEYKRLLDLAHHNLRTESICRNCKWRTTGLDTVCRGCRGEKWEWEHADEVLALIGDESNGI